MQLFHVSHMPLENEYLDGFLQVEHHGHRSKCTEHPVRAPIAISVMAKADDDEPGDDNAKKEGSDEEIEDESADAIWPFAVYLFKALKSRCGHWD